MNGEETLSHVKNSSTAPELYQGRKVLPPLGKSNTAQNLTLTNVGLHNNDQVEEEKVDLDQTTMIGSALDLDSIDESGGEEATVNSNHLALSSSTGVGAASSHAGSQVGLLKLSAV
jgi:hypothetical protein